MKRFTAFILVFILCTFSLCACVPMGDGEGDEEAIVESTSPDEGNEKKAETMVRSFINQIAANNYEGIKEYIYLPENAFVSQADIEWFIPRSSVGTIAGAGKGVSEILVNGSSIEKKVAFKVDGNTYALVLKLGDDNKWKIVLDDMYVENWSLKIPFGCSITVDEQNIDSYKKDISGETESSIYTFPAIARKEHSVVVTSSLYGTFKQNVTPKTSSDTYPIVCEISDAETGNILKCIQNIWNGIYNGYLNGAEVPDIKKYFTNDFDTNTLTQILTNYLPSLCTSTYDKNITYQNFFLSDIQPWKKDNYGAAILASDNSVQVTFAYRLEFTDSEGDYHNCNKVTTLTMAYEDRTYKIKSLNDSTIFTYNNYKSNDF